MTTARAVGSHKVTALDTILNGLMSRYTQRVPDVERVISLIENKGLIRHRSEIENDHIAFRTLGVPNLGIRSFEKIFLHHGYERRDPYSFTAKKLDAYWYAPPRDHYPRIFISELRVDDLSPKAASIIRFYADTVQSDPVDSLDLDNGDEVADFLHQPLWQTPTWSDYSELLKESEYAAWVIYNRYYLNHFTISVHNLPAPYNCIPKFNELLNEASIPLNDSGGQIKISPDKLLWQSSTVAAIVDATFANDDVHAIAGSYVEFAERKVKPEYVGLANPQRCHRREGFEASNADKIFESTFTSQTTRS